MGIALTAYESYIAKALPRGSLNVKFDVLLQHSFAKAKHSESGPACHNFYLNGLKK